MTKRYALRDVDSCWYEDHGLATTEEISRSMKFDSTADAERVQGNLASRFILPFELVTVIAEPVGRHGQRWHICACEQCGHFPADMDDPTFDAARVVASERETAVPLRICESCAKANIEAEMMRLWAIVN